MLVRHVLSQLSYAPEAEGFLKEFRTPKRRISLYPQKGYLSRGFFKKVNSLQKPFFGGVRPRKRSVLQRSCQLLQIFFFKHVHRVTELAGHLRPALVGDEGQQLLLAHAQQGVLHPLPAAIAPVLHGGLLQKLQVEVRQHRPQQVLRGHALV